MSATYQVLFSASAVRTASDAEDSTAGQTAGESDCYKLAFYNIGANVPATPTTDAHSSELSEICDMVHNTNKRIIDGLTSEICDMAHDKCADVVGISVLFNPNDDRWQQHQAILEQILQKLNSRSERRANSPDRNAEPASKRRAISTDSSAEPPAWKGESDAHYVVVWKSQRLVLKAHKEIIYQWPSKITKDLQFQQAEWPSGPPVHVYHHCSTVRSVPVVLSVWPGRNAAQPVPVMVGID